MDEAARRQYCEITAHYGNITNSKISKILAKMWRNEKDDIKMYWQRLADRKKMEHSQAHPVHIDKSTSTTTIVAKPIATAATTTATLTPAPAADTFIKSLLPQLSSSHDNNILNIIPSTGDADDPGYFIADNNNYEPSISSPLSPLTPLIEVIVDQNENLNLNSSSSLNPSLSPSLSSDIKFEFKHQK
ncbi:13399_t:CDS:2 [Entrophospora sp. SA101]|nr:7963_t:CDS:2 [Entrophospora sp. SA101]CAJ0926001.1 13399_t:CDS:2 [Entrophospora sp. SA101]